MSEGSDHQKTVVEKDTVSFAVKNSDGENGDVGIIVHAAPLARKLKGRHMQMIAIGKSHLTSTNRLLPMTIS